MKKSEIYKKKNRVRARLKIDGKWVDKLLMEWQEDWICPLTDRQLRRRSAEYLAGKLNSDWTPGKIITTPIQVQVPGRARDRAREKRNLDKKQTKAEKFEKLRNKVARGFLMSPRLAESARSKTG